MIFSTKYGNNSIFSLRPNNKQLLLIGAAIFIAILFIGVPFARASPAGWNIYYYAPGSGCTGAAYSPTAKDGGGFAVNQPHTDNQEPIVAAGSSIDVQIVVAGGTPNAAVSYEVDSVFGPISLGALDGSGNGTFCFTVTISTSAAGACHTTPQKISINGANFDGNIIDHFWTGTCGTGQLTSSISTTVIDEGPGNFIAGSGSGFLGDSFHDTATITTSDGGTPTGTVTYHYFTDGTCGTEVTTRGWPDTVTISGGTVPDSQSTGAITTPGSYSFQAEYSGGNNYLPSAGDCEPFTVSALYFAPSALTAVKTATPSFTRTYSWGISKDVSRESPRKLNIPLGGSATFHYTIIATGTTIDSDFMVSGTITVSNPNVDPVTGVTVSDSIDNGGSCLVYDGANWVTSVTITVPASGSTDVSYQCTFTTATASTSGTNTASVSWPTQTLTDYYTPLSSGSASPAPSAPYDFSTATPTIVGYSTVTVKDTLPDGTVNTLGTCAIADSPCTFYDSFTTSGVGGTCTDYTNTATIVETSQTATKTVTVCVGEDLTVSKTATAYFTRAYNWGISKSVTPTTQDIASGGTATFNYGVTVTETGFTDSNFFVIDYITVTNPNDWEPISYSLSNALTVGTCAIVSGPPSSTLPAGASQTFGYQTPALDSCTKAGDSGTDIATATVTSGLTQTGSASGSASFTFGAPTTVQDDSVTVTDSLGGSLGSCSVSTSPCTFTYSHSFSGVGGTCTSYTNTATFTTSDTKTTGSASQTVKVCVGEDLAVTKTATPTFTRAFTWGITKLCSFSATGPFTSSTCSEDVSGSSVTVYYKVVATNTGHTDSAWATTGTITVANPNDWESITTTVTDATTGNVGTCSVTNGVNVVVPASGSVQLSYSCTFSSGASGTNTATATWNAATYYTPDGTASGNAGFLFTTPTTTVNNSVTVKDTITAGATTSITTLGTCTAATSPCTYTFSKTFTLPVDACLSVTNIAQVIGDKGVVLGTATAKVSVCPHVSGFLSMGFWHNNNGQGIIKGQASSGACPSAAYLLQFKPFQGGTLTTSSTCAQVAAYYLTVFNAANCGGTTCNAMLKAQMLSLALNVYFSSAPSGNNCGAVPCGGYKSFSSFGLGTNLGSVNIDLTNIACASDGGACTTGSVSSAFGGATSMTVLDMLLYQNTVSNVGGTTWYGNVKATQVLAKDAFDAINNNLAFVHV